MREKMKQISLVTVLVLVISPLKVVWLLDHDRLLAVDSVQKKRRSK